MDKDVFSFRNLKPSREFIDEVWAFDVRQLDRIDTAVVSKYVVGLAQYLVYFRAQYNQTRVEVLRKRRVLNASVESNLTKAFLDKYKKRADAVSALILEHVELSKLNDTIDVLEDEVKLLEGEEKNIEQLINAFKRELTRREHDYLHSTRR